MHAAGETNRAIADELGVTPYTVSRYLKAHPCRTCADPVVGNAKLCHACSTRQANPMRWSREEVAAAVQQWVRLKGRAPTTLDWRAVLFGGAERLWQWQRWVRKVALGRFPNRPFRFQVLLARST